MCKEYLLTEGAINAIKLDPRIKNEEMHEYSVVDRESIIDDIIGWIAEGLRANSPDVPIMKDDLKMLMGWNDVYVLSSNSTNSYLVAGHIGYDTACEEILQINEELLRKEKKKIVSWDLPKLYESLSYMLIEEWANANNWAMENIGYESRLGEYFLILRHPEKDIIRTFVSIHHCSTYGLLMRAIYIDKE